MTIAHSESIGLSSNFLTRHFSLPIIRSVYGLALSLTIPLGWILLQFIVGRNPFSSVAFDGLLYTYTGLGVSALFTTVGFYIGRREQTITNLALSDGLTGLYNKRYFQNRLDQEFERFQRYGTPMSLVQIDLDHFKTINDKWGHQAGDATLKAVAKAVNDNLRTGEIAARVGGEEICIIVSNSNARAAFQLAERLRRAFKKIDVAWHHDHIQVSASFGIAQAEPDTLTKWQLYERADQALYQAKKNGRDLSFIFNERTNKPADHLRVVGEPENL